MYIKFLIIQWLQKNYSKKKLKWRGAPPLSHGPITFEQMVQFKSY
jgi:hypothetical protein